MSKRRFCLLVLSALLLGTVEGTSPKSSKFRPRTSILVKDGGKADGSSPLSNLDEDKDPALDRFNNKMMIRKWTVWTTPLLSTLFSFIYFRQTANFFHSSVHWLAQATDTWIPQNVEDFDLQSQVVTQVINGPIITSISLLFATLVSTTVSTLHNRQMKTYDSFSKQMHEVNQLLALMQHLQPSQVEIVRPIGQELANGLFQESFTESESTDMETVINTLLFQVHAWLINPNQSTFIVTQVRDSLVRIAEARRCHFTTLNTRLPAMHYVALGLLAGCISASFLIATDQAMYVLDSIPVRMLWSLLIGVFASLAVVCYDLAKPSAGAYAVSSAWKENTLFG